MIDRSMLCALTPEVAQADTRLARAQKLRVIYLAQKLRIQGTDEIGDRERLQRKNGRDALIGGVNGVFSSSLC